MLLARHCFQPSRRQQPVSCQRSTARRTTTAPGRRQVVRHVVVRAQAVEAATAPPESPAAVSSMDDGNLPAAGDVRGGAAMDVMASSGKVKDDLPARRPYVPSGAPETTWYCWPDGFIGQSFSLAGKLQPRASPLLEDTETLYQFAVRRREMCRYSEHTIDSAESASEMVEAVVGGSVDMGMFNASGSVSLEMSREFSTRAVSHNLVASFQENELLEMVRPSLTEAAKGTLMSHGPDAFAARYGTHFVSGVGHRGAFIGSITVKLSDASTAVSGSASFKVGYAGCTGMAELKASMKNKLSTSDVTFRWHKWGVEDDESLALLEQYCATDDAKFSGMKRLAMHTADQAKGYPKLIKLRPYHTLPDYVEACSRYCMTHGQQHPIQLQEQEQALSYLTQQYRKASYIKQVTDNDRRLSDVNTVGLASTRASLAYQVRGLIRFMEEVFRSKPYVAGQLTPGSPPSMYQLCTYFKYTNSDLRVEAFAGNPDAGRAFALGRRIKEKLDEVDRLNFELFKTMQRPLMNGALAQRVRGSVHVAAACDARPVDKGGFGRWWLDYQEQETFTQKGLYLVRLAWNPLGQTGLQQVGKTKRWDVGSSTETATSTTDAASVKLPDALLDADRYIRAALADGIGNSESNVFVMFMVGINPEIKSTLDDIFDTGRHRLGVVTGVEMLKQPRTSVVFSGETWGSWASISYGITSNPNFAWKPKDGAYVGQGVYAKSGSSGQRVLPMMSESNGGDFTWGLKDADMFYDPANQQPVTMVLVEQHLQGPPDVYATGVEELPDSDIQIDAAPLEELEYRLSTYPQPTDGDADVADGGAPDTAIESSTEADALPPAADAQPPAAATAAAAGGRLVQGALEVTTSKSWADGDGICTQFDIKVTNRGPDPANSMKLQVTPPAGTELVNSWNCTRLADEAGAWVFDMPDWAQAPNSLGPGAELTVGLVVKGPALDPAAVLLLDT